MFVDDFLSAKAEQKNLPKPGSWTSPLSIRGLDTKFDSSLKLRLELREVV